MAREVCKKRVKKARLAFFKPRFYTGAELKRMHNDVAFVKNKRLDVGKIFSEGTIADTSMATQPWTLTLQNLRDMFNKYNEVFFQGHLQEHVLRGIPLKFKISNDPTDDWFACCFRTRDKDNNVAKIKIEFNVATLKNARIAARSSGQFSKTRAWPSGCYSADSMPNRMLMDVFEHELVHAIVLANEPEKMHEGDVQHGGHGHMFKDIYHALFKPNDAVKVEFSGTTTVEPEDTDIQFIE